jgi:hypothetical protein
VDFDNVPRTTIKIKNFINNPFAFSSSYKLDQDGFPDADSPGLHKVFDFGTPIP